MIIALQKHINQTSDAIVNEIADVEVMLVQMRLAFVRGLKKAATHFRDFSRK